MALDKKLAEPATSSKLSSDELDLKIAVLMAEDMIAKGGYEQVIAPALKSSRDPGQVIGQFLMQLGQQIIEDMPDDMQLTPKILLAQGGWVEQVSDLLQDKYSVKKEIMDKAEIYVASTAQQMAQSRGGNPAQAPMPQEQPAPQEQPMEQAPEQAPMPQQGVM